MSQRQVGSGTGEEPWPTESGLLAMKARYGENPARFLYSGFDPRPRIMGIADPGLLSAYLAVERRYNNRASIVEAIEARRAELDAHPEWVRPIADRTQGLGTPQPVPSGVPWDRGELVAAIREVGHPSEAHTADTEVDTESDTAESDAGTGADDDKSTVDEGRATVMDGDTDASDSHSASPTSARSSDESGEAESSDGSLADWM